MTAVGQATARIAGAGETLERHGATLERAAASAEDRLSAAGRALDAQAAAIAGAAFRGNEAIDSALGTLRQRADGLVAAAEAARKAADEITVSDLDRRRGAFLKSSRFVIDGLNSMAIDLSRALSPTLPERLMAAFVSGDRGVFVRRLLRLDLGGIGASIRQRYLDDSEFRRYVDDYVMQFEQLRRDAGAVDPDAILGSAFLTSDIGKLYLLLAESIGRPETAGTPA